MGTLQGGCAVGEPLAEAIVRFTSSLSLVSAWQIPADQQIGDSDFIATPTLFTATISGQARSLVGAANKNGIFYALDRTDLAGGPVWQQRDRVEGTALAPHAAGRGDRSLRQLSTGQLCSWQEAPRPSKARVVAGA